MTKFNFYKTCIYNYFYLFNGNEMSWNFWNRQWQPLPFTAHSNFVAIFGNFIVDFEYLAVEVPFWLEWSALHLSSVHW